MLVKLLTSIVERIMRRYFSFSYMAMNKRRFGEFGEHVRIYSPLQVEGHDHIFIRDNVTINEGVWLAALPLTGEENVRLEIGKGSSIGHFNHIYATRSIIIEDYVLTADKVYISDNLHEYKDITLPVLMQPIKQCNSVIIGEGSWIGENACVIGATIGKHCIIGANSVVTRDVPDFCVVVGAPARIIKKYDHFSGQWVSV